MFRKKPFLSFPTASLTLVLSILFSASSSDLFGQAFAYQLESSSKIIVGSDTLKNAWGRGLNNPQIQTIDLDHDGNLDLLLYDRGGYDFQTYRNIGNEWVYDPRYESSLPKLFDGWVVVADADCDGVGDLFTYAGAGPRVYKNFANGNYSNWPVIEETLYYYDSAFGWSNLIINASDYPTIMDADGDGDTDIFAFEWLNGGFMHYYKNMSMEINGNCDSMIFFRDQYCWGRFHECQTCGKYDIDLDGNCLVGGTTMYCKARHGGSTSVHLDLDGDSLLDVLLGDLGCNTIVSMRNKGSFALDLMDSAQTGFPQYDTPAEDFYFPSMFNVDVDFDGKKDLLVTANDPGNPANLYRLDQSVILYKNISAVDTPNFNLTKKNFLQEEQYDVGEYAHPALVDYDGDGDLDLFVGNRGRRIGTDFYSNISYLENIGDAFSPDFRETEWDFLGLASRRLQNLKPFFTDLTGDDILDFCFVGLDSQGINPIFHYFENEGILGGQMVFNSSNLLTYPGMDTILFRNDMPHFVDISGDGISDLLVGRDGQGNVSYYRNTGTMVSPNFTLEIYYLGGILNPFGDQATNVIVGDFNDDSSLDMALGSEPGLLTIYSDFIPGIYGTLDGYVNLTYNSLIDSLVGDMLGSSIHLAAGDLDGDLDLDMIIGSHTGGIQQLRFDTSLISGLTDFWDNGSDQNSMKVYPNPADEQLSFEFFGEVRRVQVYDLNGQIVVDLDFNTTMENRIETNQLEHGMYILKVIGYERSSAARFIVSHQ